MTVSRLEARIQSLRMGSLRTHSGGNRVGEDAMNCPSLIYVAPNWFEDKTQRYENELVGPCEFAW